MKSLLIAALVLAATPALADAPHARCLRQNDIMTFAPQKDGMSLIVTDAFRKSYRIGFAHACTGLDFHTAIAIKTFAGNLSCIQRGDQVLLHDFASPPRCFIASVAPYTPDVAAADKLAHPVAARP